MKEHQVFVLSNISGARAMLGLKIVERDYSGCFCRVALRELMPGYTQIPVRYSLIFCGVAVAGIRQH